MKRHNNTYIKDSSITHLPPHIFILLQWSLRPELIEMSIRGDRKKNKKKNLVLIKQFTDHSSPTTERRMECKCAINLLSLAEQRRSVSMETSVMVTCVSWHNENVTRGGFACGAAVH